MLQHYTVSCSSCAAVYPRLYEHYHFVMLCFAYYWYFSWWIHVVFKSTFSGLFLWFWGNRAVPWKVHVDDSVQECSTVETFYNTGQFLLKYSQKTLHSSPERARYGVSFVSSKGNILCRLVKIELYKIFAIINRAIKGLHCISIANALGRGYYISVLRMYEYIDKYQTMTKQNKARTVCMTVMMQCMLTHLPLDRMAAISPTIFSDAFS